jgi:glycerol-3-phosphate dehydrogenase
MTRFFFHLHEPGDVTIDAEGLELSDLATARDHAETAARSIMCSEVIEGDLCLRCHIEIENRENGERTTVEFRDVVQITK